MSTGSRSSIYSRIKRSTRSSSSRRNGSMRIRSDERSRRSRKMSRRIEEEQEQNAN